MQKDRVQYHIGTSGWTYAHWKGLFYPEKLPKNRWLEYYTQHFRSVEINATFYRSFQAQTYANWKRRAPQGFSYILKAPRFITHRKYLRDVGEDMACFYRNAELLNEHFGLILLQLAPHMPYEPARLQSLLQACPDASRVAVEFRHEKWETPQVKNLLQSYGAVWVNIDSPQHRLTDTLTSRRAYIRLHGSTQLYRHDYSLAELEKIAATAYRLEHQGADELYIYFNNDFEGYAPSNALALMKLLERDVP